MKFGVLFPRSVVVGRDMHEAYQEWVEVGVEAEQLGYWSYYTTQHHFGSERDYRPFNVPESEWPQTDFDACPDPFVLLSYVGAKTSTLRLGTAVLVLNWDHPLYLAERMAMVDNLTNGRLEIGVGRGAGWRGPRFLGAPSEDEVARRRMIESIEFMEKAWTGEPFSHDGEFFHMDEVIMVPKPMRERLPIIIGAHTPPTAEWAARHGYPYMTSVWPLNDLPAHKAKIERYREVSRECGHTVEEGEMPHSFFMYCAETEEEAEKVGRDYMRRWQITLESHYQYARKSRPEGSTTAGSGLFAKMINDAAAEAAQAEDAPKTADQSFWGADKELMSNLDRVTEDSLKSQLIGTPQQLIERIAEYRDLLGLDYFVLITGWGGMPIEKSKASLKLFSEQVMPHVAESSIPDVATV